MLPGELTEIEKKANALAHKILTGNIDLALLAEKMGWVEPIKGDLNGSKQ